MNSTNRTRLADALDALVAARDLLFETVVRDTPEPDEPLLAAYGTFVLTAEELSAHIGPDEYVLFRAISEACRSPARKASQTLRWDDACTAQGGFWNSVGAIEQAMTDYCNPPQPKTIRIESVARLREEKVSTAQIALIYRYVLPNGRGDVAAFREAQENRPEELLEREYVTFDPPERETSYPNLDDLHSLAGLVRSDGYSALPAKTAPPVTANHPVQLSSKDKPAKRPVGRPRKEKVAQ